MDKKKNRKTRTLDNCAGFRSDLHADVLGPERQVRVKQIRGFIKTAGMADMLQGWRE
jgi:hypothetical protein